MRTLRWLVPLVAGAFFLVACGTLQTTVPELSESVRPAGVNECTECEPLKEVDLLAGQDMKVGTVTVTNDNEQVCVTYALDQYALAAGWLLYETHLYVGATDDFPLTRTNDRLGGPYFANPIPGQFPYGDDELDGVEEWTVCISLEELGVEPCNELFVAAHSVVGRFAGYGGAASATIYGNIGGYEPGNEGQGDIWVIDPINRSEHRIFESPDGVSFAANWYPNALAYDEDNHRLYFTTSRNELLFYDFSSDSSIDALTDAGGPFTNGNDVLGATFGDGAYWYILNQSNTLYRVDLDGEGKITGRTTISMPTAEKISQGDIVYNDGVIFGSSGTGAGGGDNLKGFFSYDIATNTFEVVWEDDTGSFAAPQLAWGLDADGEKVLYGTLGGVSQTLWTVDTETGVMTQVTVDDDSDEPFLTDNRYQDLASRIVYDEVFEFETAWGEGDRFNERGNWGMWFTYKVCEPCVPASIIYGVVGDGSTGSLWQIEITEEGIVETPLIEFEDVDGSTRFYPNGLAYDDVNHRLYYAVRVGSNDTRLFMYDFESDPVLAATGLSGEVYGATWGAGKYWYIRNGTNDMRTVTFDEDGINGSDEMFEASFVDGKSFNFGDMALDASENVIYVSTSFSGTDKEFFKYDLNESAGWRYTLITTTGGAVGLQLGFGEDGVLYGHSTFVESETGAAAKEWFAVNKAGTVDSLGIGDNAYNDLSSGPAVCD